MDAFAPKTNVEEVADEIFGASKQPELDTGRVVARPIALGEIWADVRQPRRVIPASIRLVWNGNPADVQQLLNTWSAVAANAAGRTIDIQAMLLGDGEGMDTDGTPAIYESFISLLRLAGSIRRDGLINPITIINQRDRYLIESGERRWLAYWLLKMHGMEGDEFASIPAVVASGSDYVWRQAAENTARRSLNAVGMARQLALLIMAARGQDQYADYEQIVTPGDSDRRFYAQVADGNIHRIPKGFGERIQSAMGLAMEQVSRYRNILRITDDEAINDLLWLRGDVEDWPESAFRDANRLTIVNLSQIVSRDSWSYSDFRDDTLPIGKVQTPPPAAAPSTRGSYTGAEQAEAHRVFRDIDAGFHQAYALEVEGNDTQRAAADRATKLLNQAQTNYDSNRLAAARDALDKAMRIMGEAAAPADPPPPPEQPSTIQSADQEKRFLMWAWRWGKDHLPGGWFTLQDVQGQITQSNLGLMRRDGLLEKGDVWSGGPHSYRITPMGCRRLGAGFEVIVWDQPQGSSSGLIWGDGRPVSDEEFEELKRQAPKSNMQNLHSPASDKSPSEGSLVVDPSQPIHTILSGIRSLANITEQLEAASAANQLLNINWSHAEQLAESGQLEHILGLYSDNINAALNAWSASVSELLSDVYRHLTE